MKIFSFLLLLGAVLICIAHGAFFAAGMALWCSGYILSTPCPHGRLFVPLLTVPEILMDMIKAFTKVFPAINRMGIEFTPKALKLDQTYTAHITTLPSVDNVTTTYATTGNNARDLLVDIDVLVNMRRGVRLKWAHLNFLRDQKNKYEDAIALAAYALALNFVLDLAAEFRSRNFSQFSVFSEDNSDYDMLTDINGDMNGVGALTSGRTMLINTPVANTLAGDSRIISRDFSGQLPSGQSLRRFTNVGGFASIDEWPDLPLNNGPALTAVAGANTGDIFTKADHGLVTGDRVTAAGFSAGFSDGTYYAIRVSSSTFQLANSLANAASGTPVAVTADGTGGVVTPSENLTGFGFDPRAIAVLAGIPEHADQGKLIASLGIPEIMRFETITEPTTGITMSAVCWQESGTADLNFMPVLVWGKAAGRQGGANAAGSKTDYAGHRLVKE